MLRITIPKDARNVRRFKNHECMSTRVGLCRRIIKFVGSMPDPSNTPCPLHTMSTSASGLDMKSLALAVLLEGLSAKLVWKMCTWTLLGCVHTLIDPELSWNDRVAVRFISFLTLPRSDKELQDLLAAANASHCTCKPFTSPVAQRIHAIGERLPSLLKLSDAPLPFDTLAYLLTSSIVELREGMGGGHPHLYQTSQNSKLLEMRPAWPGTVTLSELLPYGREGTMRGLIAWFSVNPSLHLRNALFAALELLSKQCTGETISIIISSERLLHGLCDSIDAAHALNDKPGCISQLDAVQVSKIINSVSSALWPFTDMMPDERSRFLGLSGRILLKCCLTALGDVRMLRETPYTFVTQPGTRYQLEQAEQTCLLLASQLCGSIPGPALASVFMQAAPRVVQNRVSSIAAQEADPWKRFIKHLITVWTFQWCGAPDCVQTFADNVRGSRRFKFCNICLRVPFCSTECLEAAMNHPLSHRTVCPLIRELCCKLGVTRRDSHKWLGKPPQRALYLEMAGAVAQHWDLIRLRKLGGERAHDLLFILSAHELLMYPIACSPEDKFDPERARKELTRKSAKKRPPLG
jgi:hypothetical protein